MEAGGRRKVGSTGTPTPGADAPTGPTWSGGVGCKKQKKTWTEVRDSNPQEGQSGLGVS